jgi:predicted GNAT family N-acyltransferase
MTVSLRNFSAADLSMLGTWTTSGDLSQFMSRTAPGSLAVGRLTDDLTSWHVIVAEGREVGCVWLERSAADETVATLGIFLAGAADRGRGIGRRAIELAQRAASERWVLQTVRLRVREANARAIACYRAAGFEPVGRTEKIVANERIGIVEMAHRLQGPTAEIQRGGIDRDGAAPV